MDKHTLSESYLKLIGLQLPCDNDICLHHKLEKKNITLTYLSELTDVLEIKYQVVGTTTVRIKF
jgi:hypothetical protein